MDGRVSLAMAAPQPPLAFRCSRPRDFLQYGNRQSIPEALALDSQGDLFFPDNGNNVIREVTGVAAETGVTAVTSPLAAGAYGAGTAIPITVTFGALVTVTGMPQLALNDGGVAYYDASRSTSTALMFDYIVAVNQNTADLDYASPPR